MSIACCLALCKGLYMQDACLQDLENKAKSIPKQDRLQSKKQTMKLKNGI